MAPASVPESWTALATIVDSTVWRSRVEFDGDHRLVREGGDQFDLFLGEGSHRKPGQRQHADGGAVAQQGNAEHGAKAAALLGFPPDVFGAREHIRDLIG